LPRIGCCFLWRRRSTGKKNLVEAIIINIEETRKMGTFEKFLEECGIESITDDIFSARKELVGFTPIEVAIQ
jgi:hypothetical protein